GEHTFGDARIRPQHRVGRDDRVAPEGRAEPRYAPVREGPVWSLGDHPREIGDAAAVHRVELVTGRGNAALATGDAVRQFPAADDRDLVPVGGRSVLLTSD